MSAKGLSGPGPRASLRRHLELSIAALLGRGGEEHERPAGCLCDLVLGQL